MIVSTNKLDVSVHGAGKTQEFKMKASAKAFSIMMDGLYSNKIAACIRELSTNAIDAHIMAGCPEKPFHIKMPNTMDPTFCIRDYGVGLSDDDMFNIYTTFFESTKESSNDFTGFLGLGSKAFFSITDSANITSYFNGTRTVYVAFLNADRIPSLSTFSSMPTDEPNGLEIEVAIKEKEIGYFRDAVNNQLKYFVVKPTISGDSQFEWDLEEEYVYDGSNWKMVGAGRYDSIRAVQGQVSYPIQTHNMGARYDELEPIMKDLLKTNLLLTFEIGEININPSRESLSYDEATITNILSKALVVLKELPQQITKKLEDAETEWEARLCYRDICTSLGGDSSALMRKIEESGEINWRGLDIFNINLKIPAETFHAYRSFTKIRHNRWKKDVKGRYHDCSDDSTKSYWEFKVKKDKILVYIDGNDKAADIRLKQYCNDNNIETVHVLEILGTEDRFEEIRAALGHPDMIRASSFEKVRRVKRTGPVDKSVKVQYYTEGWTKSIRWSNYTMIADLSEVSGLYVNLNKVQVMHNDNKVDDFNYLMNAIKRLGIIIDKPLYGLRAQNRKRAHNLEYFPDFIQRRLKEMDLKVNIFKVPVFNNCINDDTNLRREILKNIPKSSDVYKVAKAISDNFKIKLKRDDVKRLATIGVEMGGKDMTKLTARVHSKYPMISGSRWTCSNTEIVNYCLQMDKLEKLSL